MSPDSQTLNLPLGLLIDMGVEHWRLSAWLAHQDPAPDHGLARHALRRLEELWKACDMEIRSMDAKPFDAGMAARVVDSIDDSTLEYGKIVIEETISPLVFWRGNVVRAAEVITRRGTRR